MQKRKQKGKLSMIKHTLKGAGLLSLARQSKKILKSTGLLKAAGLQQIHAQGDIYQPLANIDWHDTRAYFASRSCFSGGYADIFLGVDFYPEALAEVSQSLTSLRGPQTG